MEFLKKFIEQKEAEVKELRSKGEASQDVNEVRECISKIEKLNNEIAENCYSEKEELDVLLDDTEKKVFQLLLWSHFVEVSL